MTVKKGFAPLNSQIKVRLQSRGPIHEKIFASEAKEIVHDYSGGVPRQVNNIATACLIAAAATEVKQIGADLVNETMSEFDIA
jgi:general secretion pathway protein A